MSKVYLYNVPPWSIVRVPDGRLGVTPNKPHGGRYNVTLDGGNKLGIALLGTVEVEVVKYAAQIAMDALDEMLEDEKDAKEWGEDIRAGNGAWDLWKAADEKCKCGDPITYGEFTLFGECNECVRLSLLADNQPSMLDTMFIFLPSQAEAAQTERVGPLLRVRFKANAADPRPVNWPVKHPYWVTGQAADGSYAIVVAYADDEEYVLRNWPDAKGLESQEVDGYAFTDRFPKPEWFVSPA